mgnify:FL=1
MQSTVIERPSIKVIGIEVRTNNRDEMGEHGKIGPQWQRFYQEGVGERIPNQRKPDETLAIYTDYESDMNGEYSFILAKEVMTFDDVPAGMVAKILPATKYAVFTACQGPTPDIVIEAWQHIWGLKPGEVGGDRAYLGDFEVYDSRSSDPKNAQIDVFLSVK